MPQSIGSQIMAILPYVALIALMLFATIVPQRKRNKEVKKMLDEMKKGDWVRTIGGVSGKIVNIKDEIITIETGPQHVQLNFTRGAIATVGEAEVEAEGLTEAEVRVATDAGKKKK